MVGNSSTWNTTHLQSRTFPVVENRDSVASQISQTTAYVVIFFLSLIGNSVVLTIVRKNLNGSRKIATNVLVAHMAFADVITTIFGIPVMIWRIWLKSRWFTSGLLGLILCKVDGFVVETAFAVSAVMITIIALERYLVVFYPTRKIMPSSKAFTVGLVAWLCSAVFYSPKLHAFSVVEGNNMTVTQCYAQMDEIKPWREIEGVLLVMLFLLTLGFYLAIIFKVRYYKVPSQSETRVKQRQLARARINRRVLWQSLVIIFVHYLCWIPYLVVYLSCLFSNKALDFCGPSVLTHFLVLFFGYCNASANPFVYAILSDNFRSGFKSIVCMLCSERVHPKSPVRNKIRMKAQQEPTAKAEPPPDKPHLNSKDDI